MPREAFFLAPRDRLKVYVSIAAVTGALLLGVVALAFFVAFAWPSTGIGNPMARVYAGEIDDFEVGVPVTYPEGKFHLVKREDGSFVALYWKDPHFGCSVPWREGFVYTDPRDGVRKRGWFRNPCHGETYDAYGVRIFGPSPRNLDQFPVEVVGDKVYVFATEEKLILGEGLTPP